MARLLYCTAQSFSKYYTLQDAILRSRLPITLIKNEWLPRVHIWIFGRIGVEKSFGQKQRVPVVICLSVQMFKSSPPNFLFGTNLAAI